MPIRQHRSRLALVTLLLTGILIAGCDAGFVQYQPTPIPADVTELYRTFGNGEADTVPRTTVSPTTRDERTYSSFRPIRPLLSITTWPNETASGGLRTCRPRWT